MNRCLLLFPLVAAAASAAEPALTIYNANFALVREMVPLSLKAGVNHVDFGGATSKLEPDSVVLRDPTGKTHLEILEQSYRSDAVSEGLLLSLNEGKTIDFVVRDMNGGDHRVLGEIVRSGYVPGGRAEAPIIQVDGKLRFSLPGEPLFPALADDTILKPTLSWELSSAEEAQIEAELGYVTGGFSWQASYNLVADETGDQVDVLGWVTIRNASGMTFKGAAIKLMAGEVAHIDRSEVIRLEAFEVARGDPNPTTAAAPAVTQKSFDDFHLYTLPRPLTLHDGETKQVEFMTAPGVQAKTIYTVDTSDEDGPLSEEGSPLKVQVSREFKNSVENHLGLPFPKGVVRLYRRDKDDGRLEYVGEDEIEATATDETVRLRTGNAFDVVAHKKVVSDEKPYRNEEVRVIEVTLHNHKKTAVEVKVNESLPNGTTKLSENDFPFQMLDATTAQFVIPVAPDGAVKLRYKATTHWN